MTGARCFSAQNRAGRESMKREIGRALLPDPAAYSQSAWECREYPRFAQLNPANQITCILRARQERAMTKKPAAIPEKLKPWIEARKRHRLSHMHIQMAKELGMNPKKFGKLDNHRQEPWKAPLPIFIESIYFKRFGKERPDKVKTIEEMAGQFARKRAERKARKVAKKAALAGNVAAPDSQTAAPDAHAGIDEARHADGAPPAAHPAPTSTAGRAP
jgi:hypothetical protein